MRRGVLWAMAAVLPASAACDPVPFASIELLVRQPAGVGDRTRSEGCTSAEPACLQLTRRLEGGAAEPVFLGNDFRGPTAALTLGAVERVLDLEIFTGDGARPVLLGRADPVRIPAIDGAGTPVAFRRPVLFAAVGEVEELAPSLPTAQSPAAVCGDGAGNGFLVGPEPAWVPTATLFPETLDALPVAADGSIACAALPEPTDGGADLASARGPVGSHLYAFVGDCDAGTGTLRAGTPGDLRSVTVAEGNGCDGRVAVRGQVLWLLQQDAVGARARETLEVIATAELDIPAAPAVDAAVLRDGSLVVAMATGGLKRFSVGDPTAIVEEDLGGGVAARLLTHGDTLFALTTARQLVALEEVREGASQEREVALQGLSDIQDAVILSDGTVVALGPEGIAVEGEDVVPQRAGQTRTALSVTAGDAVLLWGGGPGVDVFVPGLPAPLAL